MSGGTNSEWEVAKENIQPNQQVKKLKMPKAALSSYTEDVTLQQQQFENKLRSYTGEDPLSLWCEYIKWGEQNFPRGSREKKTKELIELCLPVLSSETKYFNDDRFVSIMIKYAILSCKPIDVYKFMHSKSIGYNSAKFYISWSREVEKLGNFKQADEILIEGLKHRAEPFEKLQSYYNDFKLRFSTKIKESSERLLFGSKNSQSLDVLTPKMKRFAPNSRYEGTFVENNEVPPLTGPYQKSLTTSIKVPFKIHDSENINPSVQLTVSGNLNFESCIENEQKLNKLNIIKPHNHQFNKPSVTKPTFEFHCDEQNDQDLQTPRSASKAPNIFLSDSEPFCPPIALFEPPDPLKKPMYPKNKVYTGAEEFQLEEIRAAEWFDKKKKKEQEALLIEQQKKIEEQEKTEEELKKQVEYLTKQVELLQSQLRQTSINSCKVLDSTLSTSNNVGNFKPINSKFHKNSCIEKSVIEKNSLTNECSVLHNDILSHSQQGASNGFSEQSKLSYLSNMPSFSDNNTDLAEAAKMVQELFNKTLSHSEVSSESRQVVNKDLSGKSFTVPSISTSNENFHPDVQNCSLKSSRNDLPFSFYCDPTATITSSNANPVVEVMKGNFFEATYEEDVENIPPEGYVQDKNKRELAGILQSSKNILFIPLEEQQEESDDDCSDMEGSEICPNERQFSDETLIPPSNTEQFSTAKFLSSTPFVPRNNSPSSEYSDHKVVPLEDDSTVNHLSSARCQSTKMELKKDQANSRQFSDDTLIPPSNTEQFSTAKFLSSTPFIPRNNSPSLEYSNCKVLPLEDNSTVNHLSSAGCQSAKKELENDQANSELKYFNDQNCPPRLSKVLSVIMETSQETYSKSSSNSSSSLTRSNNLDQLSSQRVSMFKPYSKFEPSALSSVSETQNNISDMVCEENKGVTPREEHQEFQIHITDVDPFDQEVNQKHLKSVNISNYKNLNYTNKVLRGLKTGEIISIGNRSFEIVSLVAEGAYAKVFIANDCASSGDGQKFALKVCKNSNEWEFYICCELQKRLEKTSLRNSVMQIISAGKYSNGIVLVSDYSRLGTLLDIINFFQQDKAGMPELIVMYFTREILLIVSELHEHGVIHSDIKPDNFLLANNAFQQNSLDKMAKGTSLQLIDFGRAIDLSFYSKGVCFTSVFDKAHFKCNEMKENKPWVFQLDWYGVASCIHTMLFSNYMTVKKKGSVWELEKKFKRYWCTSLWEDVFYDLLNIPECYQELNVKSHIGKIESKLQQESDKFLIQFSRLAKFYHPGK